MLFIFLQVAKLLNLTPRLFVRLRVRRCCLPLFSALWAIALAAPCACAQTPVSANVASAATLSELPSAPVPVDAPTSAPSLFSARGPGQPDVESDVGDERYHWRGLLLESFAFISIEDGVRLAADNTLRSLIVEKPFWHDYIASLHQFNMRRWNDGDDFLVNYIGHPMQGSISGYIEVQNHPVDRRIQFGERGYWPSRGRAFLWSTAYSTYSEIGPTGEAAIGNEGGFTYDLRCDLHCNATNAKPSGKETNNTGWVDFIVTPTAGTLWMVAEDVLDKEISARLVERSPNALFPKIVRGALNPTRTFSNGLRGRLPWYRDWDYPATGDTGPAIHFDKAWENADGVLDGTPEWQRFEFALHSTSFATTITTKHCQYCVQMTQGYGLETSVKLWHWFYADTDLSYQSGASPLSSDRAGGDMLMGYFGVRGGYHTPHYAVNLAIRPGFVQFNNAYLTSVPPGSETGAEPALGTTTHFAWNTMLSGDYKFNEHMALRLGVEESVVRYRNACLDSSGVGTAADLQFLNHGDSCQENGGQGTAPYFTFLSHEDFVNRGSWGIQFGPVISFGSSGAR